MVDSAVIGFAGMTHLGLNSGVAASEKGFRVVAFDPDEALCANLRDGQPPINEPDLVELMSTNAGLLNFSSDPASLTKCDVVYVAPDVPTDDTGGSDLSPVLDLIALVDGAMRADAVLVVLSQVPPGFMRRLNLDRKHVYYQVETLIFGQAVQRALHPERYIVGCADPQTPLPGAFKAFLDAHECPLLPMQFESAELAKISINCCLVASVSVANTLAEICEEIGADWSEIAPALKLDRRIGPYSYLTPGLGISGGNLERDLATVIQLSDANGTDSGVVRAWVANSGHRKNWVLRAIHREVIDTIENPEIGILGLAYKQDTHSTKNSPSFALIENLGPFKVRVYDPVVPAEAAPHPNAIRASNALEACQNVDVLAVMTAWDEFRDLDPEDIAKTMGGNVVIDPFKMLDQKACIDAGLRYITLGSTV